MSNDTQMKYKTNVDDFISELSSGTMPDKLGIALSQAAQGVILHGGAHCKKAKVSLELSIEQIGDQDQVIVSSKIASLIPTKRGKKSEEDTTDTPFFAGKGGQLTINPPKEEDSGQTNFELHQEKDGRPVSTISDFKSR